MQVSSTGAPRWMTTYSDMVTLLLAFFVMLFAFSTIDLERFRAIMSAFQGQLGVLDGGMTWTRNPAVNDGPVVPSRLPEPGQWEVEQLQWVRGQLDRMVSQQGLTGSVELVSESRGLVVRFADRMLFDLGRADLREEARRALDGLSGVLAAIPNHIRVEGHTDNLPIRNERFPSNWELSTARATTVVRYLVERHGLPPERLSAAGYGEYRPLVPNDSPDQRARNRRVDVVILRLGLSEAEPVTPPEPGVLPEPVIPPAAGTGQGAAGQPGGLPAGEAR